MNDKERFLFMIGQCILAGMCLTACIGSIIIGAVGPALLNLVFSILNLILAVEKIQYFYSKIE